MTKNIVEFPDNYRVYLLHCVNCHDSITFNVQFEKPAICANCNTEQPWKHSPLEDMEFN